MSLAAGKDGGIKSLKSSTHASPAISHRWIRLRRTPFSVAPYNEVISVSLVERLVPILALACAAAYCIALYMRAGKAHGTGLARLPCPQVLDASG